MAQTRLSELRARRALATARLDTGAARCWGNGLNGRLGYGNTSSIGDGETPASAGDIDVGGAVQTVESGGTHTCSVLGTGALRCWGNAAVGALGYGNLNNIGDGEAPSSAGNVQVF